MANSLPDKGLQLLRLSPRCLAIKTCCCSQKHSNKKLFLNGVQKKRVGQHFKPHFFFTSISSFRGRISLSKVQMCFGSNHYRSASLSLSLSERIYEAYVVTSL